MRTREFKGFRQYRENARTPWRFNVIGFDATATGQHGECLVLRADGGKIWVPIDAENRILIAGRRYGPERWDH